MVLDLRLATGKPPIVVVDPVAGPDAASAWLAAHASPLRDAVREHGAVLIRGLGVADAAAARSAVVRVVGQLVRELEGFAPRLSYGDGIYSSSQWPANELMCMHHEQSYRREVPTLVAFACLVPPAAGGATGVADAAAVLNDLPADLRERFAREGWQLQRHYAGVVGMRWQESFGTDDRRAVEEYCRAQDIEFTWRGVDGLDTRQRCPAVVAHPDTGIPCWFNQIAFLSEWTMDPDVREYLRQTVGPDALPFNSRHGDGSPIAQALVDTINEVYDRHTLREPWQRGDLMVVDNVRMAHSREPYQPPRTVLVGFGHPRRIAAPTRALIG